MVSISFDHPSKQYSQRQKDEGNCGGSVLVDVLWDARFACIASEHALEGRLPENDGLNHELYI